MTVARLQKTFYDVLGPEPDSRIGKAVSLSVTTPIILNIVALVLETVDEIHDMSPRAF